MKSQINISVLTPSWNRSEYLRINWIGLTAQSAKSFEWIVVDDGSTDNTQQVMHDLMNNSDFPITYARFDQRVGKCRADNLLLNLANGNFVIWCDSDDSLTNEALNTMTDTFSTINNADIDGFIGVVSLCADPKGSIQSTGMTKFDPFVCTWHELSSKYGMSNDMCIMQNRRAIGDKRFSEHDLVMSESGFWHQFMHMNILCIPDVLKIMTRNTPNRISGSPRMEYCRGKAYAIVYADSATFHERSLVDQLNLASRYHRYSIHGDIGFSVRNQLFTGEKTFAYYVGLVPGALLAFKDILQGRVVKTHLTFEAGKNAIVSIQRNELAENLWRSDQ